MFPRPPLTPVIKVLLVGLFSSFIVQLLLERALSIPVVERLAIASQIPLDLTATYRIFTHVLVEDSSPGGAMWLLVGLLFIWWAGSPFEMRLGGRQTAIACVVGTAAAGVVTLIASQFLPGFAIGLGPILLALIAGYAVTLPPQAQLSFFGVLPLKPMGLVWLLVAFSVFMGLVGANYAGVLGDVAAIFGTIGYMRWLLRPRRAKKPPKKPRGGGGRRFEVIEGGGTGDDEEKPRWLN